MKSKSGYTFFHLFYLQLDLFCETLVLFLFWQVTLNKGEHFYASTCKFRTEMTLYHWVAVKAIPYLKKDQNMGARKLHKELGEKY